MLISFAFAEDAEAVREQIAPDLPPGTTKLSTATRGFDGALQSDLLILALSLSPVMLHKIADVLIKLVDAKSRREVKINGMSIKGYSIDEVIRLMEHPAPRSSKERKATSGC